MFVSIAQLFYGQEKYTIQGEFPDNSLDGKYIILTDKSFLPDEYKRKWKASDDEVNFTPYKDVPEITDYSDSMSELYTYSEDEELKQYI